MLVGLCIGGGIGYAAALLKAGTHSVLLARPAGDSFARVYSDMAKLNAAETLASNCKGTSDVLSALSSEANLIEDLRNAGSGIELSPTIDVAEGRLAIRIAASPGPTKDPRLQSVQEARAQKLLGIAGWRDPSPDHARQIVLALDQEQCQLPPSLGMQTR